MFPWLQAELLPFGCCTKATPRPLPHDSQALSQQSMDFFKASEGVSHMTMRERSLSFVQAYWLEGSHALLGRVAQKYDSLEDTCWSPFLPSLRVREQYLEVALGG